MPKGPECEARHPQGSSTLTRLLTSSFPFECTRPFLDLHLWVDAFPSTSLFERPARLDMNLEPRPFYVSSTNHLLTQG